MRCLDVDTRATWDVPYREMLAVVGATSALDAVLADENLVNRPHARMDRLARIAIRAGVDSEVRLRELVTEFFRTQFTHLNLYHACRIADRSTYDKEGVRLSDINELDRFACSFFGNSPQLNEAIRDLRAQNYDRNNHGKIGLWFARSGAVYLGHNYASHGSEYLVGLAGRLGPLAIERLAARGRAAVIRCRLPVVELAKSDIRVASILPLQEMLRTRDPEASALSRAIEGATMHVKPIPPGAIAIEFLDETLLS